jgi:hypothetical protein
VVGSTQYAAIATSASSIALGYPFKLAVNQTAYLEQADLNFRFVDVTEDSRCPSDVQCVWAGQVSVSIEAARASSGDAVGNFTLTIQGSGGPGLNDSSTASVEGYLVKLASVEPYPVSTRTIQLSEYVATLVVFRADANAESIIASNPVAVDAAGNTLETLEAGNEVMLSVAIYNNFNEGKPFVAILEARSLDDGGVTQFLGTQDGIVSANSWIDLGLPWTPERAGGYQLRTFLIDSFDEPQVLTPVSTSDIIVQAESTDQDGETIVTLREGEREGPLLVQKIFPDRVEGLNFLEYPVAMEGGLPITLRIGEKASNGCTVVLTLTKIQGDSATFLKTVDEDRPCPICWFQLELMSGWP